MVGWVARSKTQQTRQHPRNVGFHSSTQPTGKRFALFNGEYTLVDLILNDGSNGILYYDPWAFPFGGSESLVALIESFGHYVHFDSWHEGSHLRQIIGWDYSLAKNLVAKGQGFIPK
jgi:hypothetical protein